MRSPTDSRWDLTYTGVSHDSQSTSLRATQNLVDLCVFELCGTSHFVTDIVEQLAWVTSVLQAVPKAAWIVEYVPKLSILAHSDSKTNSDLAIHLNGRLEVSVESTRVREHTRYDTQRGSSRNFGFVSGFPMLDRMRLHTAADKLRKSPLVQPSRLTPGYDVRMLLLPTSLQEVISTVPKRLIKVTSKDQPQRLNDIKLLVENFTGCLWDWWPLRSPLHPVEGEKRRIEWTVS